MVNHLFKQIADEVVDEYSADFDLKNLSLEQRLDFVQDLLRREGFMIEWKRLDNEYYIQETSCPYYHVGQTHPEICTVDETLISNVLSVPVKKVKCILNGDSVCTYVVNDDHGVEQI
jgi:predicted ArsR family transcriptional regulator